MYFVHINSIWTVLKGIVSDLEWDTDEKKISCHLN